MKIGIAILAAFVFLTGSASAYIGYYGMGPGMMYPAYEPAGYSYNATPWGYGAYDPGMMSWYHNNATPYWPCSYYAPSFGMMGGYGYPYGGMMKGYGIGGMMGPGMMSGYGYPYGMMGYASGFNTLFWVAVVIIAAAAAYLLGKSRTLKG